MAIKPKEIILNNLIFILLAIALPVGETVRITYNEIAVTILDIVVGVTVLYWIIIKRSFSSRLLKPIVLFSAVLLLSLAVNLNRLDLNEILASFLYLIRWSFYALLYFIVLSSTEKKKIEKGMLVAGSAVVLLGFMQYFLYPDLRNLRYAGWDEHLYRMFSSFLDPNFVGIFFVLFLLFILDKLFSKPTFLLKLISLLTLTAVILTFSRSAYISLMVGLVILFLLKGKRLAVIGILGLVIFLASVFVYVSPRSEGTNLFRIASGEARLDSLSKALTISKDHPILGVGFNSYRYAQQDYGYLDKKIIFIHSGAGTDNSFLFILATSGIVGFLAFIYLLFRIFSINNPLIKASIVVLIVNSLFINSLFYPSIMLWMWVILGLKENT